MGPNTPRIEDESAPESEARARRHLATVVMVEAGDVDAEAETQREPILALP